MIADTGWRDGVIHKQQAPWHEAGIQDRESWKWRSITARSNRDVNYILLIRFRLVNLNCQAILGRKVEGGWSAVGRYEYHSDHPGLHLHAHCDRGGLETGPTSLDNLQRIPERLSRCRQSRADWTKDSFLNAARQFYRVVEPKGSLL